MRSLRPAIVPAIVGAALLGLLAALLAIYGAHTYGVSLFFGVSLLMGFAASAFLRMFGPHRLSESIGCALMAGVLLSFGFLTFGLEGLVCIVLVLPLATPFLLIGAIAGYLLLHRRSLVVTSIVVLAAIAMEPLLRGEPPLHTVETSVIVHAPQARVWSAVVALDRIPRPSEWMYRVGLACPERTRIESPRAGGYRVCTLSTGQLVEQIEVWKPERKLRWRSRSAPPPMRELNPFHARVDAPHLHGYYASPRGEFTLEPVGSNMTKLTRRTWYSVRLYPNAYWRFFCRMAIAQIHRTVLDRVRSEAEGGMRI